MKIKRKHRKITASPLEAEDYASIVYQILQDHGPFVEEIHLYPGEICFSTVEVI